MPPDPSPVRRLWGGAGAGSPSRRGLRGPAGDAARAATMAALNQQVHLVSLETTRKTDRLSSRRDTSLCILHHSSVQLVETRTACKKNRDTNLHVKIVKEFLAAETLLSFKRMDVVTRVVDVVAAVAAEVPIMFNHSCPRCRRLCRAQPSACTVFILNLNLKPNAPCEASKDRAGRY